MALRNDSGGVREENDQSSGCEQGDSGETKSSGEFSQSKVQTHYP